MSEIKPLLDRAHQLLDRLALMLPEAHSSSELDDSAAFRWCQIGQQRLLESIQLTSTIRMEDLLCIEQQKSVIDQNTRQLLAGLPANNVLLWGPRGTGKSSLIKAVFNQYKDAGLKIIEVDKTLLHDLPHIVGRLATKKDAFIIYCDDLSFTENDNEYKALKVALDGSINQTPDNILIYATSNRRHLLPESMQDNLGSGFVNEELHMSEAVEEKISLSERFGLWLAFHPFNQQQYLQIVDYWLDKFNVTNTSDKQTRTHALQWALERGSRSGRCAWQFARHWAGQKGLAEHG